MGELAGQGQERDSTPSQYALSHCATSGGGAALPGVDFGARQQQVEILPADVDAVRQVVQSAIDVVEMEAGGLAHGIDLRAA